MICVDAETGMFLFGLGSSETKGVTNRIKLSYRAWKWRT